MLQHYTLAAMLPLQTLLITQNLISAVMLVTMPLFLLSKSPCLKAVLLCAVAHLICMDGLI